MIRNDPGKSELSIGRISIQRVFVGRCVLVDGGQSGSPHSGKRTYRMVKGENSHAVPVVALKLSG